MKYRFFTERRGIMEKKERKLQEENQDQETVRDKAGISENWAEETIADLDDWIESQGIYIRQ